MKISVLHLSHTDISTDARILKEISSLNKCSKKFQLYGICFHRRENGNEINSISNSLEIKSLKILSRKIFFFPKFVRMFLTLIEFTLRVVFNATKLKPKIIHCHDVSVLLTGVILKIIFNTKLIYDAHELESNMNGVNFIESKLITLIEKNSWNFIDHFITVSPSILKWYNETFTKINSSVIYNFPYYNSSENSNYLKNVYNIPKSHKVFLYIGALSKGRSIEDILNIFKKREIKHHIVFLGYGELKKNIINASKKYSNIHFHKKVRFDKVINIAKSADVGLCLIENVSKSDFYCLPNKLFEYVHSKIPILASNFPDLRNFIDKYKLGKCIDLSNENIYQNIKNFKCLEFNHKKSKNFLVKLSWTNEEKKLLNIYYSLIK